MQLLDNLMQRFVRTGSLRLIDAHGQTHVYEGVGEPRVTVRLTDPALHRGLFFNPELKAGEAYMDGTLIVEQGSIRDLLTLYALNRGNMRGHPLQVAVRKAGKALRRLYQRNPAAQSRKNVAHHYDLPAELYSLFLDSDLNYSCAYFLSADDTLEVAQQNKLRHIAAKLDLRPGQRVLDIGSGWGGMAMFLAEHADVDVTGVTLSVEQQRLATERAKARGLSERVRFELTDYRAVTGVFDRIVSIGMFEHVGIGHFDAFFGKINELLTPEGVAVVHSIGRKGGPGTTGAWIRKYIFPGGYSPALSETLMAIERRQLWVTDIEILRMHYALTLREWDKRFQKNRAKIAAIHDEQFCRMWEFYLVISELSFSHGKHMNFQVQMTKSVNALPLDRTYMARAESKLGEPRVTLRSTFHP